MIARRILFGGIAALILAGEISFAGPVVDVAAVRDVDSLEVTVLEDWRPAKSVPGVRRKLIEVTVCEWWPGQKVRIPVTLNAPMEGPPCESLLFMSMGLAVKMSPRIDPVAVEMLARGVGVIQMGIGTIDAMAPAGTLHLGMREQLLKTKDPRFSAPWIWGMSYMRALTAALAEEDVFRGAKVIMTGGSKVGIATACAAIFDERITGMMPVVAPPIGKPGGGFVSGMTPKAIVEADAKFRAELAAGKLALDKEVLALLDARDARRGEGRISLEEALAAGWSRDDVERVVEEITDLSRVAAHRKALDARGVEYFFCVGTNDTVSPGLLELGREHPDFPIFIVPGGMHGGPKMGPGPQVPSLPETKENLTAFCTQHFFGERERMRTPEVAATRKGKAIFVEARFGDGPVPERSELWWSVDRSPAGSLPYEHDAWESVAMVAKKRVWVGQIPVPEGVEMVDLVTVHHDEVAGMPGHVSGPLLRLEMGP